MQKNRLRMSLDDGCASDIRAAALASMYGVEAVFYIPIEWRSLAYSKGYEPLTYTDLLDIAAYFEIGAHTVTHRHLTSISSDEARWEVVDSKSMMEALIGQDVNKFCPPRGYTNAEITAGTLRVYDSQRLTKGPGLVHIHPNSGANDNVYWTEAIGPDTEEVWGHSWEIDKFNLWDELEEVLREHSYTQL